MSSQSSSFGQDDEAFEDTSTTTPSPTTVNEEFRVTSSLEDLQTEEQKRVLSTVSHLRQCGLESVLPLPQLVVCGDQSAGKSSVLEALTEIPFPRNDNLCTRFATEINLINDDSEALTIEIIPDSSRPANEKSTLEKFNETITDFDDLPRIMDMAMEAMGISKQQKSNNPPRAFSRDVLKIKIRGPKRPHLTLVDLPGLIASATVEATTADVDTVREITEHYISQSRTICLAVITAKNDIANQKILQEVRKYDPNGERTLGIITKPDMLDAGSGSEQQFIKAAKNENVHLKLGWHVVRNRKYEEANYTLLERNMKEISWFRQSNFKVLPKESVGIENLRTRLADLLFEHIKKELPKVREQLETQLTTSRAELQLLGDSRANIIECRAYLVQLSTEVQKICAAAVEGHYEGRYFQCEVGSDFTLDEDYALNRTRALVQIKNKQFADAMRIKGHKYYIDMAENATSIRGTAKAKEAAKNQEPEKLTMEEGLHWIQQAINRTRGKELVGDINPLLVSELFWEQSSKWERMATEHMDEVFDLCTKFLKGLLRHKAPKDVESRLWSTRIGDELKGRNDDAMKELKQLIEDLQNHPINYNHYYTDSINKRRQERDNADTEKCIQNAKEASTDSDGDIQAELVLSKLRENFSNSSKKDPEIFSCEDALDRLLAIYKVLQKVFIANVTTQVIERHIVRGLDRIFDPIAVNKMTDKEVEVIAMEPKVTMRQREYFEEQIKKLEEGKQIFRSIMGGSVIL